MGGFGSGRGQRGKDTTSDMRALDIRRLQRDGLLIPRRAFGWHWTVNGKEVASIQMRTEADRVILNYRSRSNGGEWQAMEYPVRLEWTGCNLGGRRAYQCQRETDDDRAMRRADTIRRRLGWEAGIANPEGDKPKGMHWRTFNRMKSKYDAFANASWAGTAERLGLMNRRLTGLGLDELPGYE